MIFPTIHRNGTSREHLLGDFCKASIALDIAYEALKQTAPNGRDYYPQGAGVLCQATQEHLSRLKRLDEIKVEIDRLASHVDQEVPA